MYYFSILEKYIFVLWRFLKTENEKSAWKQKEMVCLPRLKWFHPRISPALERSGLDNFTDVELRAATQGTLAKTELLYPKNARA